MSENEKNGKKVVLYIEDENTNRLLVKKILEPEGFIVLEAEDGLTGIELAKKNDVDIILLDINMSGMNGFEIATRLKSIEKIKNVPLVAFTASITKNSKEKALISGCDGFITKPIEKNNFLKKFRDYLNGKKDNVDIDQNRIPELMKEFIREVVEHLEKEIRELKIANEDLLQLDKLKSDFISIASHELRTPLVTIIGYVGLLLSKRLGNISPEQEKVLSVVERNSRRLERIVKDLFIMSQLEKGIDIIKISKINPITIVEGILEDNALILANRELEAKLHIIGDIPYIECDEDKISQVIGNIVNNSIKFTKDGGKIDITVQYPSKKIETKYGLDSKLFVEIIIEDTGIGIPENKLTKIFGKFVELGDIEKHHSSDTEFMGGGSGLGLSISKGIVEKHNGYIWAENREKEGTRMVVILPLTYKGNQAIL